MDITQLQYFITLARTLNFSEAARRNYISQPSISHHISELERQLGTQLFVRTSHSVKMTNAGKEFLPYAVQMVDTAQQAIFRMRQTGSGERGHIAVSGVTTASETVSKCLTVFARRYPDVLVDITFTSGGEQVSTMLDGKYDFHFALEDMVPRGNDWEMLHTHTDDLCLALPKSHPLADKPADFEALRDEPFIVASESDSPSLYGRVAEICSAFSYRPRIVNRYDKLEAVLLSVGAGLGISIIPRAISRVFYAENVSLVPLEGVNTRRSYVVAWRSQMTNVTAIKFLEVVRECFPN